VREQKARSEEAAGMAVPKVLWQQWPLQQRGDVDSTRVGSQQQRCEARW